MGKPLFILFFTLFFFQNNIAFQPSQKNDRFRSLIEKASTDTEKVNLYCKLSEQYFIF